MEVMADNVLSESDKQFIHEHAVMIRQFASGQFGGGIPMEIRQQLESITNKLGRRYMISWTCSPCLKKIGIQLEPYTWQ